MAEEVQAAAVFELRAEGGQLRAEIADTAAVVARFERSTVEAFNRVGKAASDTAALEASSKRYVSAIEREALATERKTAALVLSAAEMRRAEAAGRGETANAAAAIARLEAAEAGYRSLSSQMQQMRDINVFGDMLAKSSALGQVGKNIDNITAALERLDGEAKALGQTKVFEARVAEAAKLGMAEQYMASYARAGNSMVAAERAFAADRSFVDSLKKRSDAIGKTQADLLELEAAQRGLSAQAAPHIAALRAQEQALGVYSGGMRDARVSANQLKTGLAQLPMQFTDIFTSLAGGQNPLLVFIQQGGQIKDSFGGVGNALRAVASAITPMALAIGGAAVAVGSLGLAYKQGSEEVDAYRAALVLTGNAAGATIGQLNAMAIAVSANVGTQAKAAETIAALAATGRVAAADLGKLAEAAIRLEREGGPAVKETVKAFADLAKDPSKAVVKLNEDTNFLTLSLYKQIKALDEQGKTAQAASLAQTAYADAVNARAKTLEGSLGSLEKAWRGITDTAKSAWDAMLGVGRQDTADQAIAKVQQRIAQLQGRLSGGRLGASNATDMLASDDVIRQQLEAAQETERVLKRSIATQGQAAASQAALAAETKKGIKALDEQYKAADKAADALKKLAEAGKDLVFGELAKANGFDPKLGDQIEKIAAAYKLGSITADQMHQAMTRIMDAQPYLVERTKAEEKALEELDKAIEDVTKSRLKALEASEKENDAAAKRVESLRKETDALRDRLAEELGGKVAKEESQGSRVAEEIRTAIAEANAAAMDGAPAQRVALLWDQVEALKEQLGLHRDIAAAINGNELEKANAKAAKDAQEEWRRTADSIREGLTDAFRRAFESGEDFGTAFAKVIGNELKAQLATAVAQGLAGLALNGIAAAAGQSTGSAAGVGGMQTINTLASVYSAGAKAYGWYTGGTAAAAGSTSAQFVAGYQGSSAMLGAGTVGPVTNGAAGATGAGASSASWVSSAGWIAAAILGAMKASSDYSAGFRRDQSKDRANELADQYGAPARYMIGSGGLESEWANALSKMGFSDRLADLLSGSTATAALFGRAAPRIEASGAMGTIRAGDFAGTAYADILEKGGLFRSDKRSTQSAALPAEIERFFDTASKAIFDKSKEYGAALGLPVDALAAVATDIKVKITDDARANQEEIGKALGLYGDALMAGFADAIKPLAALVDGRAETTAETLDRVGGALVGVNDVLQTLGLTALQASIDGGAAAIRLQDAFGGLDGLQQAASSYVGAIYTDAERVQLAMSQVGEVLSDLGLAVPTTRAGFRALVDDLVNSGRVATEAGAEQLRALLGVAGAFGQIQDAAKSLTKELDDAVKQALPKFGRDDPYGSIQGDLAGAGVSVSVAQLMGASKDDIYAFAESFLSLSTSSQESKLAVVAAASALADLRTTADDTAKGLNLELLRATGQEQAAVNIERQAELEALRKLDPALASVKSLIYEATDAAELWSRQLKLLSGVDSIAPDFMSGDALFKYRAERIQQTLAAGGIDATVPGILGATRDQILELWNAVGIDGKEAVLEAYGAWQLLNDEMRAAPLQKQLDDIARVFGDLSMFDPEPLSAVYSRNVAELDSLQKSLDSILGNTAKSLQDALTDMIADQKALQGFRAGLGEDIFSARLRGMKPADRVASLRQREAQLFGQLGSAKDPVAVAQQLQGVIVSRIKEEADLRRVSSDAQIEALREQISGAERLQRMSEQIGQFTGSMRFSDLSPLGFEDQLSAARSLYETTVAKARGGDETAMGALTGNAQAYLQEARSFFASSEGFAGVFNSVLGELDALGAVDPGLKAAQDQLTALEKISASQEALSEDVIWASDQEVAALMQIDTALASREAANQGKIDAQIKLAQAQVDELKTLVADQKAQLVQQAAIAKALTAELIKLNGTAAETATEASLAGATP